LLVLSHTGLPVDQFIIRIMNVSKSIRRVRLAEEPLKELLGPSFSCRQLEKFSVFVDALQRLAVSVVRNNAAALAVMGSEGVGTVSPLTLRDLGLPHPVQACVIDPQNLGHIVGRFPWRMAGNEGD
jgi:hypothetical protein